MQDAIFFRMYLNLTQQEMKALSQLAQTECRNAKGQAIYLLRESLIRRGVLATLSDPQPSPRPQPEGVRA